MTTLHVPIEVIHSRAALRDLAEQLACEYAGAVAAGRIMRLVAGTGDRFRVAGYRGDWLVRFTESAVRASLTEQVARTLGARNENPAS